MKEVDADGVFGDTQDGVPLAFPVAAEQTGHPLAFQTGTLAQRRGGAGRGI